MHHFRMVMSDPAVWFTGQGYFGPSRDREIDSILFNFHGSNVYTYTPAVGLFTGTVATPNNSIITNPLTKWSLFQLMQQFGFSAPCNTIVDAGVNIPRLVNSECFLLAAFNTQFFNITNNTPNVLPGQIASLTDANSNLDNFDIDEFKIYWDTLEGETDTNPLFPGLTGGIPITRNLILEFSSTVFKFIMPYGPPFGGRRLMLIGTGNSTFFVGEFPLQNFNIQLVDGSGLYTLVEGQAYDTYYDRSSGPPTPTIDLKIPDPFVKTSFLP